MFVCLDGLNLNKLKLSQGKVYVEGIKKQIMLHLTKAWTMTVTADVISFQWSKVKVSAHTVFLLVA